MYIPTGQFCIKCGSSVGIYGEYLVNGLCKECRENTADEEMEDNEE